MILPNRMLEIVATDEGAALVELAEECCELAKASLKIVRICAGRTPAPMNAARENMVEEIADVMVMLGAAKKMLSPVELLRVRKVAKEKEKRMYGRLLEEDADGCTYPGAAAGAEKEA